MWYNWKIDLSATTECQFAKKKIVTASASRRKVVFLLLPCRFSSPREKFHTTQWNIFIVSAVLLGLFFSIYTEVRKPTGFFFIIIIIIIILGLLNSVYWITNIQLVLELQMKTQMSTKTTCFFLSACPAYITLYYITCLQNVQWKKERRFACYLLNVFFHRAVSCATPCHVRWINTGWGTKTREN